MSIRSDSKIVSLAHSWQNPKAVHLPTTNGILLWNQYVDLYILGLRVQNTFLFPKYICNICMCTCDHSLSSYVLSNLHSYLTGSLLTFFWSSNHIFLPCSLYASLLVLTISFYVTIPISKVMNEFDPTAVYIIGAFNDKATMKPISYARAKEHNIKCQRLPLDEYLQWVVTNVINNFSSDDLGIGSEFHHHYH